MEIRTHDNYEANPAGDVDVEFDEELEAPPDDDILSPDERALLTTSIAALIDDDRLPEQYHTKLRDMHQTALLAEEEVSILKDARARNHEELKSKKKEIKKLQLKVDDLKRKLIGRSHNQRTWPARLEKIIQNPSQDNSAYAGLYPTICREENMSTSSHIVHPDLNLGGEATLLCMAANKTAQSLDATRFPDPPAWFLLQVLDKLLVFGDQFQSEVASGELPSDNYSSQYLGNGQRNEVVHCISRLDSQHPPKRFPQNCNGKKSLYHRFHIGNKEIHLEDTINPQTLLAPLGVSRRWHYFGCIVFYSRNTFAFSSLGEWGRFATGIGKRLWLVKHIELMLTGSQHLVFSSPVDLSKPIKREKFVSRRTWPLERLLDMRSLKTLGVYCDESSPMYVRRGHEPRRAANLLKQATINHHNSRSYRSLRTIQGLDYITALRGMGHISLWDYGKWVAGGQRQAPVRDQSFLDYINRGARSAKPHEQQKAETLSAIMRSISKYKPKVGSLGPMTNKRNDADSSVSKPDPRRKFLVHKDELLLAETYYAAFYPIDRSVVEFTQGVTVNPPIAEEEIIPRPLAAAGIQRANRPTENIAKPAVQRSRNKIVAPVQRNPGPKPSQPNVVAHAIRKTVRSDQSNNAVQSDNAVQSNNVVQSINAEPPRPRATSVAESEGLFCRASPDTARKQASRLREMMRTSCKMLFSHETHRSSSTPECDERTKATDDNESEMMVSFSSPSSPTLVDSQPLTQIFTGYDTDREDSNTDVLMEDVGIASCEKTQVDPMSGSHGGHTDIDAKMQDQDHNIDEGSAMDEDEDNEDEDNEDEDNEDEDNEDEDKKESDENEDEVEEDSRDSESPTEQLSGVMADSGERDQESMDWTS